MRQLSSQTEWLIDIFGQNNEKPIPKDVPKIKLSQLVSKLGFFYEKLRNAVDYNEEHAIRRNSLERFLRRQVIFLQEKDATKISQALIYEFIRARYLPNDTLPETIITETAMVIDKYLQIVFNLPAAASHDKKIIGWLIQIASCEIDERLINNAKEVAMVHYMYSKMVEDLTFVNTNLDDKEKNLQIYIAVLRSFAKADQATLYYRLLKLHLPNWEKLTESEIKDFSAKITAVKTYLDKKLSHPIGWQLLNVVRKQGVFFTILKELMFNNRDDLRGTLNDEELLDKKISAICADNYHRIRSKLMGSIVRIIIYIFFTKTVLAFILELPYDYFILQEINWQALGINVLFHPLLMFIIAMTIRVPGQKNTEIILQEIKKIIGGEERKIVFKAKRDLRRGSTGYIIFNAIYLIMFIVSFGIVISILRTIHFNILSGLLFVFFLTIISFFGFRLRNFAHQFSVIPKKENLVSFIADLFSLPIIRVGRFFSSNFSKINIFLYILDFIIETPFKFLVEFLEKTVSFIREKKEEITE